ncbi:hypothetical protein [Pedobacter sp. GR22-6]|uniref:hypothetical protein n=1 Tax=Pedobacter sp. GR22-6 TaxID=3127957 RepID=UPI00307F2F20
MITKELFNEKTFAEMNEFLAKLFAGWAQYAALHVDQNERINMLISFEEFKEFLELLEERNIAKVN